MIKKRDPALVGVSFFVFGPEESGPEYLDYLFSSGHKIERGSLLVTMSKKVTIYIQSHDSKRQIVKIFLIENASKK